MKMLDVLRLVVTSAGIFWVIGCGTATGDDDDATGSVVEFSTLYNDYFQNCQSCHTPDGLGRTSDTEKTLDFTSQDSAYTSITTGTASGLVGNQAACNGVPFIASTAEESLIVAALDETVRQNFVAAGHPDCNADAVADMTVKVGSAPSAEFLANLKQWINQVGTGVARR